MLAAASSAITSLFARYGPQSVRASLSPCLAKESATPSLPSHLNRPGRARGARTRDAPFEGLADRAMRRSFRTHQFGVSRTQGFTLGWYAVPRWGLRTPTQLPHVAQRRRQSGTLAVARLGGEHHTHKRAARKPILPRAYSARGGQDPAEPAPETHHRSITPRDGHANSIPTN